MAVTINTALRNDIVASVKAALDAEVLEIRGTPRPASASDAATGTLLAQVTLPATAFAAPSGGAIEVASTWSATVLASGTAVWGRFLGAGGSRRLDVDLSDLAGGGDLKLDSVSLVEDGIVAVVSGTITMPSGE